MRPVMAPSAGTADPTTTIGNRVRREWFIKKMATRTCNRPVNGDKDGPQDTSLFGYKRWPVEDVLDN